MHTYKYADIQISIIFKNTSKKITIVIHQL